MGYNPSPSPPELPKAVFEGEGGHQRYLDYRAHLMSSLPIPDPPPSNLSLEWQSTGEFQTHASRPPVPQCRRSWGLRKVVLVLIGIAVGCLLVFGTANAILNLPR